jgi:Bacterial TSP3 repeat
MRRLHALALALAPTLAAACSDAALYDPLAVPSQPNKVAFTGRVCTDNPAERSFPLRVVFLVDNAASIPVNDPAQQASLQLQRVNAIRDAVTLLRSSDTQFALIRYGGDAVLSPEGGFTSNTAEIIDATGALTIPMPCSSDGCRRIGQAFQLGASLVTGDLLSTAKGPRSRTKYVFVNIQYGPSHDSGLCPGDPLHQLDPCDPPPPQNANCRPAQQLGQRVEDLRNFVLENGAADLQFHAIDLSQLDEDANARLRAEEEMELMGFRGTGEYRQVCSRDATGVIEPLGCSPSNLTLLNVDINSARNVFLQKSFVVTNFSAISTNDGAVPDSDMDGFADDEEVIFETDPTKRDTDEDGIGDKIEVLLSTVELDPLVADDPPVCLAIPLDQRTTLDTDGDGLKDCEEALLRLDATLFDTDADGAPDLVEFLAGTNFLDEDGLTDSDFDGSPNVEELRAHTDPRSADAKARQELAYLYREVDLGIRDLLFTTQPREITGVIVEDISVGSGLGNGQLSYLVDGDRRFLAWRDAAEPQAGPAMRVDEDGTYTLYAHCGGQANCKKNLTVNVTRAILPPYNVDELLRVAVAERQCTDFRVRNVTLVETLPADGRDAGFNDIRIFFGQVPSAVPDAYGIFRVAQFPFTFIEPDEKTPNVADQLVEDFRFVLFE